MLRRLVRQDRRNADLRVELGSACVRLKRFEEAATHYRAAVRLRPGTARILAALGYALKRSGRLDEAIAIWRETLALDAENPAHWNNLGDALLGSGAIDEGLRHLRRAATLSPHAEVHSNLLLALHYAEIPAEELAREHQAWAERRYGDTIPRAPRVHDPRPGRKLRIGYLSADFRDHSVALLIRNVLERHRRDRFSIVCFPTAAARDRVTEQLRKAADVWAPLVGLNDDAAADRIEQQRIDILLDLSGHTGGNRLGVFARKPAPIQVTYCGYPDTTGLTTIDYRITDEWCDPGGQTDHLHSEKLVRLAAGFISYRPPRDAPRVSVLPALSNGYVTFGCLAGRHKITDRMLEIWAGILRATPRSRLILKCGVSAEAKAALRQRFSDYGIRRDRVRLLGSTSRREHMQLYSEIDVALDTFPYAGTITTCEALWMGTPVVTLAGRTHASRVGVSLLSRVGLEDWVAQSADDYAGLAVQRAGDVTALARLRRELRGRVRQSSLGDPCAVTRSLEAAYRSMWRDLLENLRRQR